MSQRLETGGPGVSPGDLLGTFQSIEQYLASEREIIPPRSGKVTRAGARKSLEIMIDKGATLWVNYLAPTVFAASLARI